MSEATASGASPRHLLVHLVESIVTIARQPQIVAIARISPRRERHARHHITGIHDVEDVVVDGIDDVGELGDLGGSKGVAIDAAIRPRDALARDGVCHHVIRSRDKVDDLVEDLAAILVGRRRYIVESHLGKGVLHVGGRIGSGLIVGRFRVRHGRKHRASGRQIVVIDRGILEEPGVILADLGRDMLPLRRRHVGEVHARGESARSPGGILELVRNARRLQHRPWNPPYRNTPRLPALEIDGPGWRYLPRRLTSSSRPMRQPASSRSAPRRQAPTAILAA